MSVFDINFFPVSCLFAPKAQKGIDKGKESTRFLGTVYSRLKIHVDSKIDLEIVAHSHFHLFYMMKRAGRLKLLRASF